MSTSPQGEYRVFIPMSGKTYKLDGYVPKEKSGLTKDLAIEFHGCAYHGNQFYAFCKFFLKLRA